MNKDEEGKRDNRPRNTAAKRNERDVNSWMYKFHNRDPKKYEKIVFTAETEIPALPAKDSRLKQPSKEQFDLEMAKLDGKI